MEDELIGTIGKVKTVFMKKKGSRNRIMVQPFLGRNLMFKTVKILLAATMLAGSVGAAQAATIVLNNGAPYSEVVHANRAAGTTLNTLTKHGDIPVALYWPMALMLATAMALPSSRGLAMVGRWLFRIAGGRSASRSCSSR